MAQTIITENVLVTVEKLGYEIRMSVDMPEEIIDDIPKMEQYALKEFKKYREFKSIISSADTFEFE